MSERNALQAHINDYWHQRGSEYDVQPGHGIGSDAERAAWITALGTLLPAAPADIADVGAGTGFLTILLAELGHRVAGVDFAEGMLAQARAKAEALPSDRRPTLVVGDAHEPPLEAASLDALVSRHVIWTLADPARALANWHRLLRPGGRLVAIDGLWWAGRDPDEASRLEGVTRERWERAYGASARTGLPMMLAQTMDPIVEAVRAAGFSDVAVSRLDEVERVEREHNPERERSSPRYVVTATRPA